MYVCMYIYVFICILNKTGTSSFLRRVACNDIIYYYILYYNII